MKYLIILACALALAGCTNTNVTTPTWSLKRTSFLQNVEIPSVTIATNGTASLQGYSTDGGNQALGTIVGAAVAAGIKSALPAAPVPAPAPAVNP